MPSNQHEAKATDAGGLAPGQVLLDRYRIVERIGRGSTGVVYRARDNQKNREIALKVMYPERLTHSAVRQTFLAEARTACELYHPGIVKPTGVYSDDNLTFLTAELLEGRNLRQVMDERRRSGRPFTREEILRIVSSLTEILQYAQLRTVHRNLKPENIWIDARFNCRITDFGVAALIRSPRPTRKKPPAGTALYIAPEQWKSWRNVERTADQYALGVLICELLCGSISARRIHSIRRRYRKPGKNPLSVAAKMMALNPVNRFASIQQAGTALVETESGRQSLLASRPLRALAVIAVLGVALFVLAHSRDHLVAYWDSIRPLTPAEEQSLFDDMITRANSISALDRQLRRARSELESRLRKLQIDIRDTEDALARSAIAADKTRLRRQLDEARAALTRQQALQELTDRSVFNDTGLRQLDDKIRRAFVLFEQGEHQPAIRLLEPIEADLEARLRRFDDATSYLAARQRLHQARTSWQRFNATAELQVPAEIERREQAFAEAEGRAAQGDLAGIADQYAQWATAYRADLAQARQRVEERERYIAQRAATRELEQLVAAYLQRHNLRIGTDQAAALQQRRIEEREQRLREDFRTAEASSRQRAELLLEYRAAAEQAIAEARRQAAEEQALKALATQQQAAASGAAQTAKTPAVDNAAAPASAAPRDALDEFAPGLQLVDIPPGSFRMGSPDGGGERDEKPAREVAVGGFTITRHEITFAQYDHYATLNGRRKPDDAGWGRGDRPVINVDWNQASDYADWLSQSTGLRFRLPSEAEWEYAAKSGSSTAYPWGDTASHEQANYGNDFCCSGLASGADRWVNTAPVGSFPANRFGIHDMHGNVAEWVLDCWNDNYLGAASDARPRFDGHCSQRVVRGGSWSSESRNLRSANRNRAETTKRASHVGFRLVLER